MISIELAEDPVIREQCFSLRYDVLRKPWGQPPGSERDQEEDDSLLFAAVENGEVLGTVRMQYFTGESRAQLRYMAVSDTARGRGTGQLMEQEACRVAKESGMKEIFLQARENALGFYEKCGYTLVEKTYLLFGSIQHYLMKKEI